MAYTYKEHYNIDYLMNSKDADGRVPFAYVCCSVDRGPGKTYSASRWLINRFFNTTERFGLLVRDKGSLGKIAKGVLSPYLVDNIEEAVVSETVDTCKSFSTIYLSYKEDTETKKEIIGFCFAIKGSDDIKKYSGLFSSMNISSLLFDEFQTKGSYIPNEVEKVLDICESIFRGGESHKAIRDDCRLILLSNCIQFNNPYFTALDTDGLGRHIQSTTRFYKGHGVVFERCEVEGLSEMHEESGPRRAFAAHTRQLKANQSTIWVMDNESLVCKPDGFGTSYYLCTLSYNNKLYGVHHYDNNYYYISTSVDNTCPDTYALTVDNNNKNLPLLRNNPFMAKIKNKFLDGEIRVSKGEIQSMLIDIFA